MAFLCTMDSQCFFFEQWFHYVCTTTLCSILLHHSAVFCMCFSPMCTRSLDACSSERQWGVSFFVSLRDRCMYSGVTVCWLAFVPDSGSCLPLLSIFTPCLSVESDHVDVWFRFECEWIGFVNWMDALSINELRIQDTLICPREKSAASLAWAEGLPLVHFRFCKLFVWKVKKFFFCN